LLHGQNALLTEVRMRKGTVTPVHHHAHESYLYVVSGRVRTTVGGEACTACEPLGGAPFPTRRFTSIEGDDRQAEDYLAVAAR
jgi:hypothetical protein